MKYPYLYGSDGKPLAELNNIIESSANEHRTVNGPFTFTFDAHEANLKSEYFDMDGRVIVVSNQSFDISNIEVVHDMALIYEIETEHVAYRLKRDDDNKLESFADTGTPAEILGRLFSSTDFSVGVMDFTDIITVTIFKECDEYSIVKVMAAQLGAKIDYSDLGFTIDLLATLGQNNGQEIRFGSNLVGLRKIIKKNGDTAFKVRTALLKNSNEYVKKGYHNLEKYGIGDTIHIFDEITGTDVYNDILSYDRNPVFEINMILEIANTIELITDTIVEIDRSAIKEGKLYNNVGISSDYGFRARRSDKLARSTYGAGTMSMDKGDGIGNYVPRMHYDVLEDDWVFDGKLTAAEFVGGSIDLGNGNFTVDNSGFCRAYELEVFGGSGIGNFSDAGDLATLDSIIMSQVSDAGDLALLDLIDTVHITNDAITAPKIFVTELSALSANLGSITSADIQITDNVQIGDSLFLGLQVLGYNLTTFAGDLEINSAGDIELNTNSYVEIPRIRHFGQDLSSLEYIDDIKGFRNKFSYGLLVEQAVNPTFVTLIDSAGHGLDKSGSSLLVDETELDFSGESRTWFEDSYITRPYFGTSNYCYVDTDGVNVVFRDSSGGTVITI